MRRFVLVLALTSVFPFTIQAQARRVPPRGVPSSAPIENNTPANAANVDASNAAALYAEAKDYAKFKFEEFKTRKVPYSDDLREQTLREQRQLAARFALQLSEANPAGENLYYLGMLHILATNEDAAAPAFKSYLAGENLDQDKAQTARSFLALAAARRQDFSVAEAALAEYLKSSPVKTRERLAVERELALQYHRAKVRDKAVAHAEEAFAAARTALRDTRDDDRLVEVVAELGNTLFEIYAETRQTDKAARALELMREVGINSQNYRLYVDATDRIITYQIENNRKAEALAREKAELKDVDAYFRDFTVRGKIKNYFNQRERHYKILGEIAPNFTVAQWLTDQNKVGEQPLALSQFRGKVVLLDFWATWCKPCFDSYPELTEWHQTYGKQGLQIVGVTRYYGQAGGFAVDEPSEFAYLQKFKREQRLPYPFAVARDTDISKDFYVSSLPTIAIVDKKGVLRFIETGARANDEIEKIVQKLLAEN